MGFVIGLLLTVQMLVCIFMILIVLMQPSKADGGLGASFGSGATDTLFGARTGNVLTKATIWATAILFLNSILLGFIYSRQSSVVLKTLPPPVPAAVQKAAEKPAAPEKAQTPAANPEPTKSAESAKGSGPVAQPAEKTPPAPATK